jgi:hydrogenase nickel incorporation protein HypA/HybF
MHELSIAMAVVETVEDLAREQGGGPVEEIRLRVGSLAGVVPAALLFSFDVARQGTVLEAARLVVEEVPARARCAPCTADFAVAFPPCLRCPRCGGAEVELFAGRELELAGVSLAEPEPEPEPEPEVKEEAVHDVPSR